MSSDRLKVVGVIPARYDSTRFPGKALAKIAGKPMIRHVYERCSACERLDGLYIATDDQRIYDAARGFTDDVLMTSREHESGTDRVAEAARKIDADVLVNIQGDEPLIEPTAVGAVIPPFEADPTVKMVTLARPADDPTEISSPNTCKVAFDKSGNALYFSRAPIPYHRKPPREPGYLLHVGIYAYRREFLLALSGLEKTPLEIAEGLEMLRALEHGYDVRLVIGDFTSVSVDTEDDLELVRKLIGEKG